MDAFIRARSASTWWRSLVLLAAFLSQLSVPNEPAAALALANQPGTAMNTFVIIFRQGPRVLTDSDKQQRAEDVSAWARRQNDAGHKLEPRILTPDNAHRGPEGSRAAGTDAWPVTALLFLEAQDLSEATQVAEAHPALRYGVAVEVRPWGPPVPVAASSGVR